MIKYIIKKLWPLILLFIASVLAVLGKYNNGLFYSFLESYLYFALYVLSTGLAAHFIGNILPRNFNFIRGFFACKLWEEGGSIYDRIFKVKNWKDRAFDASQALPGTAGKSLAFSRNPETIHAVIQETCVAEFTHWGLSFLSPVILLICGKIWRWVFWLLYIIANLRDIIIQRYNRPRMVKIYNRIGAQA